VWFSLLHVNAFFVTSFPTEQAHGLLTSPVHYNCAGNTFPLLEEQESLLSHPQ
jgi:hypothetical protein